jgi:acetyl-CoA carboxylase carboxyltransferase component
MVMAMVAFESQAATFAFPGATLGAMGAGASSRAMGADAQATQALRDAELDASYRSARGLGFDELIEPRETRDALLGALQHAVQQRQRAAEPVARIGITP